MNNKLYDYLKWGALIALPATATFASTVLPAYGVENTETIVLTITSIGTLIGTLIGVSTVQYNKQQNDIAIAKEDSNEEGTYEFNENNEQLLKEFNDKVE